MNGWLALTKNIKKLFPLSQAAHITSRGSLSLLLAQQKQGPRRPWTLMVLVFDPGNNNKPVILYSHWQLPKSISGYISSKADSRGSIQRESNCLHCCPPRNVPKYLLLLQVNPLNCFPALPHGLAGPRNCHRCCLKSPAPCFFIFGSEN